MDWESFYREADYDRLTYLAGEDVMVELAARFVERRDPDDFASIGCGPANLLFALAERFPSVEFHGYDVSETVVRDDRDLAAERGLDDLHFETAALPHLDGVDREFDAVYCAAVLFFVRDVRTALRALYDRVRPGGALVVNYPNEATREHVDAAFEGRKREAFSLVLEGENLLTREDVAETLDADLADYWAVTDGEEHRDPWWPMVVAER